MSESLCVAGDLELAEWHADTSSDRSNFIGLAVCSSCCCVCLDDEPADYYLSEMLALLTSVKSARITDGGIYDGRMGQYN